MSCAPRQRFHSDIYIITPGFTYFQNAGHVKARSCMAVILNRNIGMRSFDICHNLAQRNGASDTCHVFNANLVRPQFYQFQCHIGVIFHRMDWRMGDTKRTLRNHSCIFGISDRRSDIAYIIQPTECTGDIRPLCFLYFIKQLTYIGRNRTHTKPVESTIQHVCLYPGFMERLCPCTHRFIRVFTKQ